MAPPDNMTVIRTDVTAIKLAIARIETKSERVDEHHVTLYDAEHGLKTRVDLLGDAEFRRGKQILILWGALLTTLGATIVAMAVQANP